MNRGRRHWPQCGPWYNSLSAPRRPRADKTDNQGTSVVRDIGARHWRPPVPPSGISAAAWAPGPGAPSSNTLRGILFVQLKSLLRIYGCQSAITTRSLACATPSSNTLVLWHMPYGSDLHLPQETYPFFRFFISICQLPQETCPFFRFFLSRSANRIRK